mmetsp:Transcript_10628/g.34930  ORF Transcript_10628/g.34930 Transcript_10628/m.34930 type:complete len:210 (+) Transcript_10628:489-1118(+)
MASPSPSASTCRISGCSDSSLFATFSWSLCRTSCSPKTTSRCILSVGCEVVFADCNECDVLSNKLNAVMDQNLPSPATVLDGFRHALEARGGGERHLASLREVEHVVPVSARGAVVSEGRLHLGVVRAEVGRGAVPGQADARVPPIIVDPAHAREVAPLNGGGAQHDPQDFLSRRGLRSDRLCAGRAAKTPLEELVPLGLPPPPRRSPP